MLNVSPKYSFPAVAKTKRIKFQNRPRTLPNARMPSFLFRVPFNSKVRQMKRALKNMRATVDSVLMKRKDVMTHSAIAVKKSPEAKLVLATSFRSILSFPLSNTM